MPFHCSPIDTNIQEEVIALTSDKMKSRRFNIREILNRQSNFKLTPSMKDMAEFIFQLSEKKGFGAIEVGQGWLALKSCYTRQTINESLQKLEKIGLIKRQRRELGFTHRYQFCIPPWLKEFFAFVPKFIKKKHLFCRGVSGFSTLSNVDLSSYKEYTEYRDSKEERLRRWKEKNPGGGGGSPIFGQNHETWTPAYATNLPKEVNTAPKTFLKEGMASLRAMFRL